MKRVMFAALLVASAGSTALHAEPDMDKYNKSCGVCHTAGVAGAPKTGNADAWEPRLEKGMETLVSSVKNGLNAMPPKGMCFDCTDEEYMELINYMATPAE